VWCSLCDRPFSRFSRTPTCDRQTDTDTDTDRRTDTGPWLVPRMHSIARYKCPYIKFLFVDFVPYGFGPEIDYRLCKRQLFFFLKLRKVRISTFLCQSVQLLICSHGSGMDRPADDNIAASVITVATTKCTKIHSQYRSGTSSSRSRLHALIKVCPSRSFNCCRMPSKLAKYIG